MLKKKIWIILCFWPWCLSVWAFRLSPMSTTIFLDQNEQAKLFRIENDSDEKIAVQITMAKRVMDETGKEIHPEVEDFLVFPGQLILAPKEKRSIKVQWSQKHNVQQEEAYRIIAEQLPIDMSQSGTAPKASKANLKILLKYVGALYVSHSSYTSDVKLEHFHPNSNAKPSKLIIQLFNAGSAHQIMQEVQLKITQGNQHIVLQTPAELEGLLGENMLAKHRRVFAIPWPKALDAKKDYQVQLLLEKI